MAKRKREDSRKTDFTRNDKWVPERKSVKKEPMLILL